MRVTRLEGPLLNYWVAKSEGLRFDALTPHGKGGEAMRSTEGYCPSMNWSQGGTILANDWYEIESVLIDWFGPGWAAIKSIRDQPLTWFMRAYVATKFGDEVEEVDVGDYRQFCLPDPPDISATRQECPQLSPTWFSIRTWFRSEETRKKAERSFSIRSKG